MTNVCWSFILRANMQPKMLLFCVVFKDTASTEGPELHFTSLTAVPDCPEMSVIVMVF